MTIDSPAALDGVSVLADPGTRPRRFAWGLAASAAFLLLVLLATLFPGVLAGDPNATDPVNALAGPGGRHAFGTDELGRDIFARIVFGARSSVVLGVGSIAIAALLGGIWGMLSALGGRLIDEVLMRIADILLAFPPILLSLLVVAFLGAGPRNVIIALAAAATPGFARLVRIQALTIRQAQYVQAAVALGVPSFVTAVRHVVPNVAGPLSVVATTQLGGSIVAGASLSFLGLGARPPAPEWGSMLSESRDYLQDSWSMIVFPALAIILTIIAVSVLGRELQLRFEGRRTH